MLCVSGDIAERVTGEDRPKEAGRKKWIRDSQFDQDEFWYEIKLLILKRTPPGFVSLDKLY